MPLTARDLRYLRRKETPQELIEPVLARLDVLNLVNDEEFASFWIASREQSKPKGSRAIKNELRMKGVACDIANELVDEERAMQAARCSGCPTWITKYSMGVPTFLPIKIPSK